MVVTATLLGMDTQQDRVIATILYTDGVTFKLVETLQVDRLSLDNFKAKVQSRINDLTTFAAWWGTLPLGLIDTTVKP